MKFSDFLIKESSLTNDTCKDYQKLLDTDNKDETSEFEKKYAKETALTARHHYKGFTVDFSDHARLRAWCRTEYKNDTWRKAFRYLIDAWGSNGVDIGENFVTSTSLGTRYSAKKVSNKLIVITTVYDSVMKSRKSNNQLITEENIDLPILITK